MRTKITQKDDFQSRIETYPFIKWPGGKQWIASKLSHLIRAELINTYFEPFMGAGAVFFKVCPEKSILSDINKDLIDCIKTVREAPNDVLRAIWRLSNSKECYHRIRRMRPKTKVSAAARLIYLTKTCWGGIYRINQNGQFNTPFGGSGRTICRKNNFMQCAKILQKANIKCEDFESIIDLATKGDVIYADPPYTTRGQNNGFIRYNEHLFAWKDQERLAFACQRASKRGAFVIVSGLWHDSLIDLYSGWWAYKIDRISRISAKVEKRKKITEAIFINSKPNESP